LELLIDKERLAEVGSGGGFFRPPFIPDINALFEEFEMLWVGHG
jgi:hypothetical protein